MKRKRTKQAKKVNKLPGRRGVYDAGCPERAYKLCLLGLTDMDLAVAFGINVSTIEAWQKDKPEFRAAVVEGKEGADTKVALSFFQRAIGYSHPDTHIMSNRVKEYDENGRVIREYTQPLLVPITKHYAPDVTAGIFWLKNRQRTRWSDVNRLEHSGSITHKQQDPNLLSDLKKEDLKFLAKIGLKLETTPNEFSSN